ncbi:hypothetical protein BH09SUM1_BH09SUM1_19140 [soil metagenome]
MKATAFPDLRFLFRLLAVWAVFAMPSILTAQIVFTQTLTLQDNETGAFTNTGSVDFGQATSATTGYDPGLDVLAPPTAPGASSMASRSGLAAPQDRFAADYRPSVANGVSTQWVMQVVAGTDRIARVTWPGGVVSTLSSLTLTASDSTGTPLSGATVYDMTAGGSVDTPSGPVTKYYSVVAVRGTPPPQGIIVSATTVNVPEGASASFTVRLTRAVAANTLVTVARFSGDSDISVTAGAALTFTAANWSTPQTVTLSAADDDDAAIGVTTIRASSTGLTPINVTAKEVDNDTLAILATPPALNIAEGSTATFTLRLTAQPLTNATVAVARFTGDTDVTVASGASLIFTTSNWNTPQTVTLAAAEDADAANGVATIRATASGITLANVTATEVDNDTMALVVSTSAVTVAEGSTTNFTVRLSAQPLLYTPVYVTRTSGDTDISVFEGAGLAFNPSNWNIPQTVTLKAAEDVDIVAGVARFAITSPDLVSAEVVATELDNDILELVLSASSVTVPEGRTASFTVKLSALPLADMTVTASRFSGDTSIAVSGGASLSFTTANWNVTQKITLTAAEDADVVNGVATIRVSTAALPSVDVTATESENDILALAVSPAAVTVPEGGAVASFTVRLLAQPQADATVAITRSSGDTDIFVADGALLAFTPANWNVDQTVSLSASEDQDLANGVAVFQAASPGIVSANVTATEADNDVLAIIAAPTYVTVLEGGTTALAVTLSAQPSAATTVSAARISGDTDITVASGASLTFTPANWDTAQTVTLAAAEDADSAKGAATIQLSSPGTSAVSVTAVEGDNDVVGLVINPIVLPVPEGSTAAFSVSLSAQPAADAPVTAAWISGDTDISVSAGSSLLFTTANWNAPQSVTLAAAEDADAAAGAATIRVSSPGMVITNVVANEVDNDSLTIVASQASINVPEGSNATFTARLSAQPLANTKVTVSRSSGDASISIMTGASLTFTPANWATPQNVKLAAAEDVDAANGAAVIRLIATGLPIAYVSATEADNDTISILATPSAISVAEGSTAPFTVTLSAQPLSAVTVTTAHFSGDPEISVSTGASLVFSSKTWNTAQTVRLAAAQDPDTANGVATMQLSSVGLSSVNVVATEIDDDVLGIVVSPTSLSVPEGSSSTFTVKLSAQPLINTVVSSARFSGDADISVAGGASLTFTPANWNITQDVTLAAAEDADAANSTTTIRLTSGSLTAVSVTATEADNDAQGIVLGASSVTVAEGSTATFTVRLAAQPLANTTVNLARLSGDGDIYVSSSASLVFTSANWNSPQTVTLAAAEDFDIANGVTVIQASSSGLPPVTLTATEQDNDTLGITVSTASVTVSEGSTATFTVKLSAQPLGTTSVAVSRISGDADISVSAGASLTFTPANWSLSQAVTLTAAEDADAANGAATIQISSPGVVSVNVTATEADNDTLAISRTPTSVTVPEGSTATFTVKLTAQPLSDTVVTTARLSGDADINVSGGASLTFTSANWSVSQTVTLAAAEDDDAAGGAATIRASSPGLTSVDVTATEGDNDTLAISATPAALTVPEGSTATFAVRLTAQPLATVTVAAARTSGDASIKVSSSAFLTFTTANWAADQQVTLSAAEDNDAANGVSIITLSATGLPSTDVTATEADNDVLALSVSRLTITVPEGGTSTQIAVKLTAEPPGDAVVIVTRTSGDADLSVTTGASLTFTTANWNIVQTVKISAAEDADAANGSAVFQVFTPGLDPVEIIATEVENDVLGIVRTPTTLAVPEGGTADIMVTLSAQPSSDLVVSVARTSGDADIIVAAGAALTFTPANWNVPQTVTIAAAEDPDAINGVATIDLSSPGLPTLSVTATETENDVLGIVVSTSEITVPEGSSAAFSVMLSAQPAANATVNTTRISGDTSIAVTIGASLVFTPVNWATPQTVTLFAAEDPDTLNGQTIFRLTASGLPAVNITATEADNDSLGITMPPDPIHVRNDADTEFLN